MMESAWKEYENDLNSMTDEEIDRECRLSTDALEEAESWLDAVALWRAAGSPRRVKEAA